MKKNSGIEPKTRRQIANEYLISYETLMRRLKKLGINLPQGVLFACHQKKIYDVLSYPKDVEKADYEEI